MLLPKAGRAMALNFPNASRSYDSTRRAVRFWGYDSAMETSFFVLADALRQLQPGIPPDETSLLGAFDSHRELICAAAAKVYKRGNKGSYDLGPTDF
jgi:hypothetical protein